MTTWYERPHEIAQRLGAVVELAQAAQNICIEGEPARQAGRELEAPQRFEEAKKSDKEAVSC